MNNHSSTLPLLVLSWPADELNPRWCDSCTQRRVASQAWVSAGEITREQAGVCRNQRPPAARRAPGWRELSPSSCEGRGAQPPAPKGTATAGGGSGTPTIPSTQHEPLWEPCPAQGLADGCRQGAQCRQGARCRRGARCHPGEALAGPEAVSARSKRLSPVPESGQCPGESRAGQSSPAGFCVRPGWARAPGAGDISCLSLQPQPGFRQGFRGSREQAIRHRLCLASSLRKRGQRKEAPEFEDSDKTGFLSACDAVTLPLLGPSCKASRGKLGVASAITGGRGAGGSGCEWEHPGCWGDEPPARARSGRPILPRSPFQPPLPRTELHPQGAFWGSGQAFGDLSLVVVFVWRLGSCVSGDSAVAMATSIG